MMAISRKRIGCLPLVVGALGFLLILGFSLDRIEVEPVGQPTAGTPAGEIHGSIAIGQIFRAPHNGLYRVDVLMATYARENTQDVIFHLRSAPEAEVDLVRIVVNASEIEDNAFHSFTFDPIRDSVGKSYYFFFESPSSVPGDAVTVWGRFEDVYYDDGRAFRNHRPSTGALAFLTYCRPSLLDRGNILLERLTENKPLFWGDKRFYVLLGLLYLALLSIFFTQIAKLSLSEEGESDGGASDSTR